MRKVVVPFSHGVVNESSFFYTKSIIDSKEMFLTSGKSLYHQKYYLVDTDSFIPSVELFEL